MKPIHSPLREKTFFRKTNKALLGRFFAQYSVLGDLEWNKREDTDVDDIDDSYRALPNDVRIKIEADLETLNDLASQRGMPCMIDVSRQWKIDCRDITAHDLAMVLFLDHREALDIAHSWWTIDHFQGYSDFRGRQPVNIATPDAGRARFKAAFSEFMNSLEKGININIDVYKDTNKIAYVACHEDYVKSVERFHKHKLKVVKDRPVFYATMVYYPHLGKLKVKGTKNDLIEFARDAFAEHILGEKTFFQHPDMRLIYDLDRFKQPWIFETDPADGIEWVHVTGIQFHPTKGIKDTIEVKSQTNLEGRLRDMNIDLSVAEITSVSLCLKFPGKGRSGSRTVNLSMPNRNNLGDSKNDQLIERYLVEWEIANM